MIGSVRRLHLRLFLLLGLFLFVSGCSLLPSEELDAIPTLIAPPESRVITYTAEVAVIAEELRGLGRIAPYREETLYFPRGGRLRDLNVQLNSRVQEGDVLARLDVEAVEHQLLLAEVDLQQIDLRVDRLRREYEVDPIGRQFEYDMLLLDRERVRLRVENLRDQVESGTIRAPFDGIVTAVQSQVGQHVAEYATVIVLADPSELEIHVEFTADDDFRRLAPGQKARVEVNRGQWMPATVMQVPTFAQRNALGAQRDRRVRLMLDDDIPVALNSLVSTIITIQEKEDALIVPNAAVRQFMDRAYVRVVEGDARREVDVQLGIRSSTHTEILRGLEPGAIVIGR